MSTIVVVKKNEMATIAGDTLSTSGDLKLLAKYNSYSEKIFKFGKSYLGFVGSAVTQLVFESVFKQKDLKPSFENLQAIFETFRSIHPVLKEKYFLNPNGEEDEPYESSQVETLIANKYGIFGVFALREVFEYQRFWAVGSGSEYALGAMYAAYEGSKTSEEIAKTGVAAGCEFDIHSSAPIAVYSMPIGKGR